MTKRRRRRYETASAAMIGRARMRRKGSSSRFLSDWLRTAMFATTLVGIVMALWLTLDDRFYVYGAAVLGAERVSRQDVLRASRLLGLHVFWVRSSEAESNILGAVPGIESVEVTCSLPARCTIAVVERQPRIVWEDDGQRWWVDREGVIMPVDGSAPDALLVRGGIPLDDEGLLDKRVVTGLEELLAEGVDMPQVLYYLPDRGLLFIDRRGWRVIVGQGAGMAARLDALESVAEHLNAEGKTPALVDVRFPEAPTYVLAEG